uniref:Uncharacterized protein n=1 Tax=Anguilla anguilla TaxID=7936 RepID=A0A0E9SRH9_ANGAN
MRSCWDFCLLCFTIHLNE